MPEEQAAGALCAAGVFLARDRGMQRPQRVTSLYLDSPTLQFLTWQRARRLNRFKLRLRAYGSEPPSVVYAEVKSKAGRWGHKRRTAIPAESIVPLLEHRTTLDPPTPADEMDGDLGDFRQRLWAFAAIPQVLLRCDRESLRGRAEDSALGITVDRNIQFQRWWSPGFDAHPGRWNGLSLPRTARASTILEIKHGEKVPAWMRGLARRLEPYRLSFSKYKAAMRQALAAEGTLQ